MADLKTLSSLLSPDPSKGSKIMHTSNSPISHARPEQTDPDQHVAEPCLEQFKKYHPRGSVRQHRLAALKSFTCDRCHEKKTSKLVALADEQWDALLCNGCYGWLLSTASKPSETKHTPASGPLSIEGSQGSAGSSPVHLPIPETGDSISILGQKLVALANVVRSGQSIATVTNYVACPNQERDPVKIAIAEMPPLEFQAWSQYAGGEYPLPKIDWTTDRAAVPTSVNSLQRSIHRAEALNRLYNTEEAEPSHSTWFSNDQLGHLPLVKAMARVIGAERKLLGGQAVLTAVEMADLQTINKILSDSARIRGTSKGKQNMAMISSSQNILGSQRDRLREALGVKGKKRKRGLE
ncbi:hypothetical protein MKZ38_003038 [Zalerion maritima]|uniref:Uncharacterized protein n=1 Tax=Zalerion maritima TaxID=339359 RepID=A0AAD5RN45_9PEZI|nr:hypothetical protein MKZ38_003038 [Zalerion maritima]